MKKQTIADVASKLGKKKGKYEKLAQSNNPYERKTGERMLQKINAALNQVFNYQEQVKPKQSNAGLPKAALGMNVGWPPKNFNEWLTTATPPPSPPIPPTKDLLYQAILEGEEASNAIEETLEYTTPIKGKTKTGKVLSNPNVVGGAIQGVGMLGDYINQMSAINNTEAPSKVALNPRVTLNKNMDTSSYDAAANRQFRTQNMLADNVGNSSVSNSMRGSILADYLNKKGEINTQAANYRSGMENQESQINQATQMQNNSIKNNLYSAQNMFANNKRMAKANALTGLMTKGQLMAKDFRDMAFQKNTVIPMIDKGYGRQTVGFAQDGSSFFVR